MIDSSENDPSLNKMDSMEKITSLHLFRPEEKTQLQTTRWFFFSFHLFVFLPSGLPFGRQEELLGKFLSLNNKSHEATLSSKRHTLMRRWVCGQTCGIRYYHRGNVKLYCNTRY